MISADLKWNGPLVSQDVAGAVTKSLFESAAIVEGQAAADAPIDLGLLRVSITSVVESQKVFEDVQDDRLFPAKSVRAESGEAIVGTVVNYAPHVEFGTRFTKKNYPNGQPFLFPALENNVEAIKSRFRLNVGGLKWLQ